MTLRSLVEQRRLRKPEQFTIIPYLGNAPSDLKPTHWVVQRRHVYWDRDEWWTEKVRDARVDGVEFSEVEARAECALLNAHPDGEKS